ncbi:MAG: glycoside hydrolase family 38 C-terminal domain-containing protein [Gemmatimonadales bacterium]
MILTALRLIVDSLVAPLGALPAGVIDGYATTLRGERFSYHSAHPTERSALLVRSLDSTNAAEWNTAPVTETGAAPRRIAFLGAMDVTDPGVTPVTFWVTLNGGHRFALPQPTSDQDQWEVPGADGIRLHFRRLLIDKFGDVHGIFTLDLPSAVAPAGAPVTVRVQGESVGRRSWFILYTVSLRPTVSVHPEQLLTRDGQQTIRLDAWQPFDTAAVTIRLDAQAPGIHRLAIGATTLRVTLPAVRTPRLVSLAIAANGDSAVFRSLRVEPVVPREMYLINHAHLDIGYTDVPEVVREKHWRGIDSALAWIERSRGNPTEARFRWNVEGLWPLQGYLETRPPVDTARLLTAVRRGDVALSALYANLMTGLSGSEELDHLTDYARRLGREHQVPVTAAMTSDVPGFTWGMVPALARRGIRYLSSGPNESDRIGPTLRAWGDRPFWWIGPDRRDSLLVMFAGRGYSWVGGWPKGRLTLEDADVMNGYLEKLVASGYPWAIVQVRVAIGGDNGVPDGHLAEVVREWNARYASPRLVIATLPQMFTEFERRYGKRLPRIRGDLTGYWEDGAVSTAREQALTRNSAARLQQAEALARLRGIPLNPRAVEAAWRLVLLWDEHTWGADRSISEPDSPETLAQWRDKQRLAIEADSASRALLAEASLSPAGSDELEIWHTHSGARSMVVVLPESLSRTGDRIRAGSGQWLTTQRLHDGSLAVEAPLPSAGALRVRNAAGTSKAGAHRAAAHAAGDSLWNGRVRVRVDRATGGLASVRWKGRELVDGSRGGWNRYRYVAGTDTSGARDATVTALEVLNDGPLVATLRITMRAPGAASLTCEVSLHAGDDRVYLVTTLDKAGVREKEAVHLAFPLAVPGGVVRMEQGLAVVRPDADQADGANRNLFPVQRWLDASNPAFGVSILTPDLPLWELNGLTAEAFRQPDGREEWLTHALPGTELVAYAMNNYWHTNFKADQPGPVTFRVTVVPHGPWDAAAVTHWGRDASEPPVVIRARPSAARRCC